MSAVQPNMNARPGQHSYADHAVCDELFRKALNKNCSVRSLKKYLQQIETYMDPDTMRTYGIIKKILSDMGESEKAAAVEAAENDSFLSRENLSSIDFKNAEAAVKILSGSREAAEEAIAEFLRKKPFNLGFYDARTHYLILDRDPMYYIMLSKRYDLTEVYFRELNEKRGFDAPFFEIKYTFISAVLHYDWECVGAMLECGYRPDGKAFAELAAYPEAFEKFRKNCYSYYCPERKRAPSQREFFGCIMSENELYRFARNVYIIFGTGNASRYFESIDFPIITTISAAYIMGEMEMTFTFLDDEFDSSDLSGLFADDVRIIADTPSVVYTVDDSSCGMLCRKNKLYDLRGYEDSLNFLSTNRRIKMFLQQNIIFNKSEKCPSMVKNILSRNNKTLTSLVIKQGLINEQNFGDTIDFLTENHLFDVINQIFKSGIAKI